VSHLAVLVAALALVGTAAAGEIDDATAVHAVIVGRADDARVAALVKAAQSVGRPDLVVTVYDLDQRPDVTVPASLAAKLANARAGDGVVAYVCTETQCSLPTSDPARLRAVIREFPRPR
jgi:uncharacterized protein YyaL (SSP411 family)